MKRLEGRGMAIPEGSSVIPPAAVKEHRFKQQKKSSQCCIFRINLKSSMFRAQFRVIFTFGWPAAFHQKKLDNNDTLSG
jgi:hypothetical protein